MKALRKLTGVLAICALIAACTPNTASRLGGETLWLNVGQGQLKAQVFARENVSSNPILVLFLHGDIPDPRPDYQYLAAKAITLGWPDSPERSDELRSALGQDWRDDDIVAAGILRPGYSDPSGDRSSGDQGRAVGDNYTPEVVDAIAIATRQLREIYQARAVILVGHSGGGAIVANILGRHPDLAAGAVLVGAACDPEAWRSRMQAQLPIGNEPNPSLLPLDLVGQVRLETVVRLLVGAEDDVVLPEDCLRYTQALQRRGVDARLTIEPGLGHDILVTPAAFRELGALVQPIAAFGR